jgi:hypothetical protein
MRAFFHARSQQQREEQVNKIPQVVKGHSNSPKRKNIYKQERKSSELNANDDYTTQQPPPYDNPS